MARYRLTKEGWVNLDTGLPEEPPAKSWDGPIQVSPDYHGYACPITGRWIEGRAAHRENLKRHGCRLQEKGEKEAFLKERQKEMDRERKQFVREMVIRAAREMDF